MQEVIREIIKIDKIAFENQEQSEGNIEQRKQEYIRQMKEYKDQRLTRAEEKAEDLYVKILKEGEATLKIEEEKAKQATLLIENRYLQIEKNLVDQLFKELFIVEA